MDTVGLIHAVASVPGMQTVTVWMYSPPDEVTREALRSELQTLLGLPVAVETFGPMHGAPTRLVFGEMSAQRAYWVTYRET